MKIDMEGCEKATYNIINEDKFNNIVKNITTNIVYNQRLDLYIGELIIELKDKYHSHLSNGYHRGNDFINQYGILLKY